MEYSFNCQNRFAKAFVVHTERPKSQERRKGHEIEETIIQSSTFGWEETTIIKIQNDSLCRTQATATERSHKAYYAEKGRASSINTRIRECSGESQVCGST